MPDVEKYMSIQEAANITGKHVTTIYKAIRRKQLTAIEVKENLKITKKVLKSELMNVYDIPAIDGIKPAIVNSVEGLKPAIEDYRKAIEEVMEARQNQLMKPLEEQALYIAGKLQAENQFLKEKLETVLTENEDLKNSIKALPGPGALDSLKAEYEEKLKQAIEQSEKDKELIAERWKKELEQVKRPWYKFW